MDLKAMRQRFHAEIPAALADLQKEANTVIDKAKAENRDVTDEEYATIEGIRTKADALNTERTGLQAQITERERRMNVMQSFQTPAAPAAPGAQPALTPPVLTPSDPSAGQTTSLHVTSAEKPFHTLGHQLRAVMCLEQQGVSNRVKEDAINRLSAVDEIARQYAAAQGMNQAVPSEGGFAVFPEFAKGIWDEMNTGTNNLVPMTDSYPVEGESLTLTANAETARTTGQRYGGVKGYWIHEADLITKSKPALRQVKIAPEELAVMVYLTDKLLQNNVLALDQFCRKAASDEINFLVGDAIFEGTGAGQPKGLMNSGCLITVAKETGQANGTVVEENVTKMFNRMHPNFRQRAVFLINNDVEPQLDLMNRTIKNVAGTDNVGGSYSRIWDPDKRTLKGRPVVVIEYANALGTAGDIVFADMKGYLLGLRSGGIKEAMSMHVRFEYAETALRFMFAADGQPWLASALTPFKGTTTTSSFVALANRP